MMRASLLALAAQAVVLGAPVAAQTPGMASPPPAAAAEQVSPEDPALTGGTDGGVRPRVSRPIPPAATLRQVRRPRSYRQCHRLARERRLQGAPRRAFVNRCQLGYVRASQP